MALTYPLTLPKAPRNVEFELLKAQARTKSPFTFAAQILIHQGDQWLAKFDYPPMIRADAAEMIGRLNSPNDLQFYLGPTGAEKNPRGTATGTPLVNGAGQTGYTLATDGWTPNITGILKVGDWIQFGTYLYQIAQDANSNGSGEATLELCNRIRVATTNNAPITVNSPVGIFRLAGNSQKFSKDVAQHYGLNLEAEEVLPG